MHETRSQIWTFPVVHREIDCYSYRCVQIFRFYRIRQTGVRGVLMYFFLDMNYSINEKLTLCQNQEQTKAYTFCKHSSSTLSSLQRIISLIYHDIWSVNDPSVWPLTSLFPPCYDFNLPSLTSNILFACRVITSSMSCDHLSF